MTTLLAITLLALAPQATATVTAKTLDGSTHQGTLTDWDTQGIQVQLDGETKDIPVDQLLELNWLGPDRKTTESQLHVELIDGSKIHISTIQITDHLATVTLYDSTAQIKIPTQSIRVVQLMPEAAEANALWKEIQKKQLVGDVLVVRKRKGPMRKETRFDYLSGVVGDLTNTQLTFQWDGETIPVKRSKVAALAYYHARQPSLPESICKVTTTHGTIVYVAKAVFDEEHASVTTPCGVRLKLPMNEIASADYSLDKLVFLSDLEPFDVQWTPKVGLPTAARLIRNYGLPRFDRSFSGRNLSLKWPTSLGRVVEKTYSKGLMLRSRTEIVYRLPAGMRRFRATAGIDPDTASQGNVDLQIFCDDFLAWKGAIDGNAVPVAIDLELRGATRLKIIVDYGKNLDLGDRLHLIEARVTK